MEFLILWEEVRMRNRGKRALSLLNQHHPTLILTIITDACSSDLRLRSVKS